MCAPAGSLVGTSSASAGECGSGAASVHAALGAIFGVALLVLALYANGVAYARLPSNQAVSARVRNANEVLLCLCKFILAVLFCLASAPAGIVRGDGTALPTAANGGSGSLGPALSTWVLVGVNIVCQAVVLFQV